MIDSSESMNFWAGVEIAGQGFTSFQRSLFQEAGILQNKQLPGVGSHFLTSVYMHRST